LHHWRALRTGRNHTQTHLPGIPSDGDSDARRTWDWQTALVSWDSARARGTGVIR
jgi:hypothetical protein